MLVRTLALAGLLLTACATGPTTKQEVCASYDALGTQLLSGNGIIGNPLFHKAGDLADVANRYPNGPNLSADVTALRAIADSDSTNGLQLKKATANIAKLCGHPLGPTTLFGE